MTAKRRRFMAYGVGTGLTSRFTVSGGPLTREQEFGWHIVDENGLTAAVSPRSDFCARLNDLEALVDVLVRRNALYLLRRVADEGYTTFTDDEAALLERVLLPRLETKQ